MRTGDIILYVSVGLARRGYIYNNKNWEFSGDTHVRGKASSIAREDEERATEKQDMTHTHNVWATVAGVGKTHACCVFRRTVSAATAASASARVLRINICSILLRLYFFFSFFYMNKTWQTVCPRCRRRRRRIDTSHGKWPCACPFPARTNVFYRFAWKKKT